VAVLAPKADYVTSDYEPILSNIDQAHVTSDGKCKVVNYL